MDEAVAYLSRLPLAGLMLVVTLGYLLGRISIKGVSAGPAAGTVALALFLGWHGLGIEQLYGGTRPDLTIGYFGFALFIYAIGFEAGPRLVSSLGGRTGWRFVLLGAIVVLAALGVALAAGKLLGLDASSTAGVLAGGVTSASAFAAASESATDAARLSVAFALTYPFGLLGLVLLIELLPRLTRTDLRKDAAQPDTPGDTIGMRRAPELTRAFRVENPDVIGKPLRDLGLPAQTGCLVTRIHREDEVLIAAADSELHAGDHVLAQGRLEELQRFEKAVGPEVYDAGLRERMPAGRRIVVTSRVAGSTLAELALIARHRCMVTRIERGRENIEPAGDVSIERFDIVEVVGPREGVREVAAELGRFEPSTHATDIAIYAGGILTGIVIGNLRLALPGFNVTLGTAGGLLLAGVALASLRRFGPFSANIPPAARQLVSDLGILLFVAETGLGAGRALAGGLDFEWWQVTLAGAAVTMLPVLLGLLLGRYVLGLRPLQIWGSIAGGMTSPGALAAAKRAGDSNEPAIAYAAAFGLGSILITVAGQIIVALA